MKPFIKLKEGKKGGDFCILILKWILHLLPKFESVTFY